MTKPAVPTTHHIPTQDWLWLFSSILLSLALRIPFFGIPMIPDEGGYAYATRGWFDGTGHLYQDLWISRPQGIFLVYGGIMATLGDGAYAFRFAAWIAIALTTVAVWLFARQWSTPRTANAAAIIFAVISSSPNLEGYTANAEVFMGLPAAFAALWLFHIGRNGWSYRQLVGVGILIGLATILKPSGIVMLPVAWGFILMIQRAPRALHLRRGLAVLAGMMIVAIPIFINGYMLGWHRFIYATITYRIFQQSTASVGIDHNLWRLGAMAAKIWPMLLILGIVVVIRHMPEIRQVGAALGRYGHRDGWNQGWHRLRRIPVEVQLGLLTPTPGHLERLTRPTDDGGLILRLWVFGCIVGIAMGGDWWAHYLIQITAPAAIWLAHVSCRLFSTVRNNRRRIALVGSICLLLIFPFWVVSLGSATSMTKEMYSHPGYPAQQEVASYIRDHTTPDDTIYVAFDQAGLYYLSDRKAAYRHLYDQELEGIPSSYSDIMSIIQGPDRPKYIISTLHPGPFPDRSVMFWQEVGHYYDIETTIQGVPIYRAKGS